MSNEGHSGPLSKDIALTGYTTSPSDRQCPDGDLSCSYNMVNEDGAMCPVMDPPQVCSGVLQGVKRGFIHTVEGGNKRNLVVITMVDVNAHQQRWTARFYIGVQDYIDHEADATDIAGVLSSLVVDLQGDVSIAAIGNTLVFTSHLEKHFILWKVGENDNGAYIDLGSDIPDPSISFKLYSPRNGNGAFTYSRPEKAEDREVSVQCRNKPSDADWGKEENQMIIHNAVMAMCNKFVAECHQKGRFVFPFLVRYAWRLFDGTLTKHSAPVLMMPSTRVAPVVITDFDNNSKEARCTPAAMASELQCQIAAPDRLVVDKWKDVISALEIFVSPPIYSYRQDINSFGDEGFQKYNIVSGARPDSFGLVWPSTTSQAWYYGNLLDTSSWMSPPVKPVKELCQEIEECSTFHRLYTIEINDYDSFQSSRVLTRDDVGNLENLVTREAMTDDYDSRDSVMGKRIFAYNNRISLANISKTLYGGGLCRDLSCIIYDMANEYTFQVFFFVKTVSGVSVVTSGPQSGLSAMVPYLYYPNMGCYKAVIKRTSGGSSQYMEVQMKPHKFLNGSVWVGEPEFLMPSVGCGANVGGFVPEWFTQSTGDYSSLQPSNTEVSLPNKIYTSEVDNPFTTLVTNIATVGQGEVLGLSTAAKALSQGQFGQFPLYAFSSDGVWALAVSSNGGFSSVQPITQDVCTNPESITQLDSSVVFVTRRGLMQLSGSSAQCITEKISTEDPFDLDRLPGMGQLHILLGHAQGDSCLPTRPFNEYLSGAVILYDYVHQRLYLGNPECDYTYVYSLKGGNWGWYGGRLAIGLNSYPQALAFLSMEDTSKIYDFSADREDDGRTLRSGLMITRPVKLDAADILKTATGIYTRGLFRPGNVGVILWGSRDLTSWNLIGSSDRFYLEGIRGDGYKYFRIGLKTSMLRGDRITGTTMEFVPRQHNRIR